jgi:hypothetical protein
VIADAPPTAAWQQPQPVLADARFGVSAAGAAAVDGRQLLVVRTGRAGEPLHLAARELGDGRFALSPLAGTTARSVEPSVAVSTGARLVAWRQDTPRAYSAIRAVLAGADGAFGDPVDLAGAEAGGVRHPAAAIDGAGAAGVAFDARTRETHLNQRGRIAIAVRPPGGGFAAARLVTATPAGPPSVAMANGRAVVAWIRAGRLEAVSVEQGRVGRPVSLGRASSNERLGLAVSARGRAAVAWMWRGRIRVATRGPQGSFRPARTIRVVSRPFLGRAPVVSVRPEGRVLVAWTEEDYGRLAARRPRGSNGIYARVRTSLGSTGTGRFGSARAVSPPSGFAGWPAIAAPNSTATFAVAWTYRLDDARSGVQAAFVGRDGPSAPASIGPPLAQAYDVATTRPLALPGGDGGATVVWPQGSTALLAADGRGGP